MTLKENKLPPLKGLVLAGGKSTRMGRPKDQINWHGKQQRYHGADLLKGFCDEVFISCRPEQLQGIADGYQALPDTFLDMGPLGGILTALRKDREAAWLVVACDLPILKVPTLRYLISNRAVETMATTFKSPHDGLPEPLITIWEPESYPVLLEFLGRGITCPRKVLINSDVRQLIPPDPLDLLNVNTPEEAETAKALLTKI